MIMQKSTNIGGLLVKSGFRPAGEMISNGKKIMWDDAHQITLVLFEQFKLQKFILHEECAATILKKLDKVHWGCLLSLEIHNNRVTDVFIECDGLSAFYATNNL